MTGARGGLDIVILGLSITSSWGNGHATTYRALVRALAGRGHRVLFLERDLPWYAENRDLREPPYGRTALYRSREELADRFGPAVRQADLVICGSYVPEGRAALTWLLDSARGCVAFYDIDTPATLAALGRDDCEYLTPALIPRLDLYLSFTGGPTLHRLEAVHGARRARELYCSFDPDSYHPEPAEAPRWELGYMGTYSPDRQPTLDRLLLEPARRLEDGRFVVAGPQYPAEIHWPANVDRIQHLSPREHRPFYCRQRFTLNVTRAEMKIAGYAPSVRLFEAAACGVPIISDSWEGLDTLFAPGREILVGRGPEDTVRFLTTIDDEQRRRLGARGRARVLAEHTSEHRAEQLERYFEEAMAPGKRARSVAAARQSTARR